MIHLQRDAVLYYKTSLFENKQIQDGNQCFLNKVQLEFTTLASLAELSVI